MVTKKPKGLGRGLEALLGADMSAIATLGQPVEWTGNVYGIPHYVMQMAELRDKLPRGIYLFPRKQGRDDWSDGWSFEFEDIGQFLAPLPRGW